jgi:hypothetical protein
MDGERLEVVVLAIFLCYNYFIIIIIIYLKYNLIILIIKIPTKKPNKFTTFPKHPTPQLFIYLNNIYIENNNQNHVTTIFPLHSHRYLYGISLNIAFRCSPQPSQLNLPHF